MSQQMDYDETNRGYQAQAPYPTGSERSYSPNPAFDDAFSGLSGQKLGQQYTSNSASPGQRLALAIVSVSMLVPLTAITLGISSSASIGLFGGLIVLAMICFTVLVVNLVFNLRH